MPLLKRKGLSIYKNQPDGLIKWVGRGKTNDGLSVFLDDLANNDWKYRSYYCTADNDQPSSNWFSIADFKNNAKRFA